MNAPPDRGHGLSRRLAAKASFFSASLLPLGFALVIVALAFQSFNASFLTPRNLSNLCLQLAAPAILTLAAMLVLLVGEIDLSIGSVSGLCAAVLAVAHADFGMSAAASIVAALLVGTLVGLAQGALIVFLRAPSFIVTLSGLLVWLGVHHLLVGQKIGEIEIDDPTVQAVASTFLPLWASRLVIVAALAAALAHVVAASPRVGLFTAKLRLVGRDAVLVLIAAVGAIVLERHHGIPFLLVLLIALAVALAIVTERTPLGVHILAIGGNAESARRAGVNVTGVRIAMFSVCSTLAAVAGVVLASRQLAVDATTGGGTLTLDAIAAAVIGGTSLFGGRGTVFGALLGAVVVASVENGLDLLGLSGDVKSVATGLMLLSAVCLDTLLQRRRGLSA